MNRSSISIIGASLFLGIIGVLGVGWFAQLSNIVFPVLLALIGMIATLPLIIAWRRPGWDLFEPIVIYSLFTFSSIFALYNKYYLLDRSFYYDEIVEFSYTEGITVVAGFYFFMLLFITIGYYVHFDWYEKLPTRLFARSSDQIVGTIRFFAVVYMLIGFISYVVILFETPLHTDPLYLYQNTVPRSQTFAEVDFLIQFAQYMYIGLFLWMATTVVENRMPSIVQFLQLFLITGAFLLLGGRARALGILVISSIFVYYVVIKRSVDIEPRYIQLKQDRTHQLLKEVSIPAFGVIILFCILSLGLLRAQRSEGIQGAISSINLMSILTLGDTDGRTFEHLLILIERVPTEFGYYYGSSYIRSVLNFIPRAFWDEKPPLSIGSTLRRVSFPEQTGGRPPGMAGIFYANFGGPGIVIGGLSFGILLRSMYEVLTKNFTSPIVVLLYSIFITKFIITGSLSNGAVFSFLWHTIPLIPIILVYKWKQTQKILP